MKRILWLFAIFLAGCGGSNVAPAPIAQSAIPPPPPAVIAFVGDSITQFWDWGGFIVPDPALSVLVSGELNDGISGNRTDDMLARFDAVLAQHPTVLVILGGTNDLRQIETPTIDNISTMAERAAATGAHVIIGTVPPASVTLYPTSDAPDDVTNLVRIRAFNTQLRTLARSYGYTLVDYYSAMVNADGTQNASLFVSTDLIHPNADGYNVMWSVLKPALAGSAQ